jgi:hypothetical protein
VPEPLKVDFDAVYEKLLAPALREAGCMPFRATDEKGAGDIRQDMFFELITADLVLADISHSQRQRFLRARRPARCGPARRHQRARRLGRSPIRCRARPYLQVQRPLFIADLPRDAAWEEQVKTEVEKLGKTLAGAIAEDEQTIGSPVYSTVEGLKPVDWSGISTARAKYFRSLSEEWRQRVKVARKERHPGDILTLAGDVPTRLHRSLGASVRILLALPRAQFLAKSVAFACYDWVQRFDRLAETCEVAEQTSRLGDPPAGFDVFSRCNLWILNTARVEIGPNSHLFSILVWDEKPTGDGPGGTSDFAKRVRQLGGVVSIINPTKLPEPS